MTAQFDLADAVEKYGHLHMSEVLALLDRQARLIETLQAKIDRLMLEYCPDEMTPEQLENWGKHQREAIALEKEKP